MDKIIYNPEQRKRIATGFVGYGDPAHPLWIFGREEGEPWHCKDEIIRKYEGKSFSREELFGKNPPEVTYGNYDTLIKEAFNDLWDKRAFFIGNLSPFGKHSRCNNMTPEELAYFGFEQSSDYWQVIEQIKSERIESLLQFFTDYNWKEKTILFCHGKEDYGLFDTLIGKLYPGKENPFSPIPNYPEYKFDAEHKRFVLRHMARGASPGKIANCLKQFI
jgi:hypothetical protein